MCIYTLISFFAQPLGTDKDLFFGNWIWYSLTFHLALWTWLAIYRTLAYCRSNCMQYCSTAAKTCNKFQYMYILWLEDFIKTKISTTNKGVLNVTCYALQSYFLFNRTCWYSNLEVEQNAVLCVYVHVLLFPLGLLTWDIISVLCTSESFYGKFLPSKMQKFMTLCLKS